MLAIVTRVAPYCSIVSLNLGMGRHVYYTCLYMFELYHSLVCEYHCIHIHVSEIYVPPAVLYSGLVMTYCSKVISYHESVTVDHDVLNKNYGCECTHLTVIC